MAVHHEEFQHGRGFKSLLKIKKEKHLKYQVLFWRGRRDLNPIKKSLNPLRL
jgi:hypothetical protein